MNPVTRTAGPRLDGGGPYMILSGCATLPVPARGLPLTWVALSGDACARGGHLRHLRTERFMALPEADRILNAALPAADGGEGIEDS